MRKISIIFIIAFLFIVSIWTNSDAACSGGICNAATCNESDINTQLGIATNGDTVNVPAGSCNWTVPLNTITHGINLIGAGIGSTNITLTASMGTSCFSSYGCAIDYEPSDYPGDHPFRISGFTFNMNNQATSVWLSLGATGGCTYHGTIQTKIRIDHNNVYGFNTGGSRNGAIVYYPAMFGVVDHNIFGAAYNLMQAQCVGVSQWVWDNLPGFQYGSANAMYFEDNTITMYAVMEDCQNACRFVWRYNDITLTNGNTFPLIDSHGNFNHANYSAGMGAEIYGNKIHDGGHTWLFVDQRGGKFLIFDNNDTGTAGVSNIQVREEYKDSDYPTNATNCTIFPTGTGGCDSVDGIPQQPQHVWMSYYWGNRYNTTGALMGWSTPSPGNVEGASQCGTPCNRSGSVIIPQVGLDFFSDTTNSGVLYGPSLPGTCSNSSGVYTPDGNYTGPGYWVTTQSTTDLTNMTGTAPLTPISGTLYNCQSTNTWTQIYTPYTYPHPLITGGGGGTTTYQLVFISPPYTEFAGKTSRTIIIFLEDQSGNIVSSAAPVNLSSTSMTMIFCQTPNCKAQYASAAFNLMTGILSFFFSDTTAGNPTITASSSGVTSTNQTETIVPMSGPSHGGGF